MDKNNSNSLLGGFEAIFDTNLMTPDVNNNENITSLVSDDLDDFELNDIKTKSTKSIEDADDDFIIDEIEQPSDTKPKDSKINKKETIESESTDDEEEETKITESETKSDDEETNSITSFFELIADQLGLEPDEEEEKPKDVESLVKYFQEVIEENSIPQYANDQVKEIDEFVRNGGKIEDYFQAEKELDLDELDITDEHVQKRVLTEFLKEKGYNDTQIERKLIKYDDAGILEDEAVDAIESLKEIKTEKKEQLLVTQKKNAELMKEQQLKFYTNVVDEIKGLNDIRGIKVPEKDKKVLLEFLFKADTDGKTKYQKEYSKSVKNLIESAYFTMKGDALLSAAKNEGSNDAVKRFKDSLKNTGMNGKTRKIVSNNSEGSIWDTVAQQLTTSK